MTFSAWLDDEVRALRASDRWRAVRTFDAAGPAGVLDGVEVISFASNDYLGLSTHPDVVAAAHDALDRWGTGATASRLVVGSRPGHEALESRLADWKRTEAALVFPTGYAANIGLLTALGGPGCLVVSDELNHASIIDGCRLSRAEVAIARHNDPDHVATLLDASACVRSLVVVDAVFSMDGDEAPVRELAEVCAARGAMLVLDEAHAVFGPDMSGVWNTGVEVARVVTLSKTLGALGGAVCGSRSLVDLLVNRARPFIFSTGLSPADAAAAHAAIDVVRSDDGRARASHLRALVDRLAPRSPSPIVPVVVGADADAVAAADALLGAGMLVPAIRPPTVPEGTARLRVALSAAHSLGQVDRLAVELDRAVAGWRA